MGKIRAPPPKLSKFVVGAAVAGGSLLDVRFPADEDIGGYTVNFVTIRQSHDLAPFLAGSVLLLVPGRWRWAGYAAVVASFAVLYSVLELRGNIIPGGQQIPDAVYYGDRIGIPALLENGQVSRFLSIHADDTGLNLGSVLS